MNKELLKLATTSLVESLNPDWQSDPDMKGTPERLAKMYEHYFRNEPIESHFEKTFPTKNNQMVIVKDIEAIGLCPHHFAPIIYKVHIGYIPNGRAIGLSKLARISRALASYPKLQENYTEEIVEALEENLGPDGIMVVVSGIHGCMRTRGVEQDSATITSACRGAFLDNIATRDEFIKLTLSE